MRFRQAVVNMTEIVECHCVTGNESYILKVAATTVPHLEHVLMGLTPFGEMRTSLVLSSPVTRRCIDESQVEKRNVDVMWASP